MYILRSLLFTSRDGARHKPSATAARESREGVERGTKFEEKVGEAIREEDGDEAGQRADQEQQQQLQQQQQQQAFRVFLTLFIVKRFKI